MAADERRDASAPDRRAGTAPRIAFVRRCVLHWGGGRSVSAFIVNLSAEGAYLTRDDFAPRPPAEGGSPGSPGEELPRLGERVACRFTVPGSELEIAATGTVSWLNSRQQHPVHGLPPGFGVRFEGLSAADRARIDALISARLRTSAGR